MFPSILLFVLLLLLPCTASAQEVTNPVWPRDWPDPTVWLGEDGRYHCLATNPTRSIVSDDLFHWEMSDVAPIDIASWGKMQAVAQRYWAPDVAMVNGKRNLYLTLYNSAEDSNIGVLQEFAPGQFQFVGIITSSLDTGIHDTIDPEVVTDPKTGKFLADMVQEGAQVPLQNQNGDIVPSTVQKITAKEVICDINHPLAGMYLHVKGQVEEVREATEQDKIEYMRQMTGGCGGDCGGCGGGCGSNCDGGDCDGNGCKGGGCGCK